MHNATRLGRRAVVWTFGCILLFGLAPASAGERIGFRDTTWGMTVGEVGKALPCQLALSSRPSPYPAGGDQFGDDWKEAKFYRCVEELVGTEVALVFRFDQSRLTAVRVRFLREGRKKLTDTFTREQRKVVGILTEKYGGAAVSSSYGATTTIWAGKGLRVHHQPWEVAVGYGRWASLDIFYEPVSHSDESQLDDARDKL